MASTFYLRLYNGKLTSIQNEGLSQFLSVCEFLSRGSENPLVFHASTSALEFFFTKVRADKLYKSWSKINIEDTKRVLSSKFHVFQLLFHVYEQLFKAQSKLWEEKNSQTDKERVENYEKIKNKMFFILAFCKSKPQKFFDELWLESLPLLENLGSLINSKI